MQYCLLLILLTSLLGPTAYGPKPTPDRPRMYFADSILKPELPWEGACIEGASVTERNGELVMFYAGAYNNWPQQIGVARSRDGLRWTRLQHEPFLLNGAAGTWNSSESGHPNIFTDRGQTYLFFQGNNDKGRTWLLSNVPVSWQGTTPTVLAR